MPETPDTPTPPAAPRPVPRSAVGTKARIAVMFGVAWVVVAPIIAIAFTLIGGSPVDDQVLDEHGVRVLATPTGVEQTNTKLNNRWVYEITLRFEDLDAQAQTIVLDTTSEELIATARAKTPMAIEYNPSNLKLARFEGARVAAFGFWMFYALAGMMALGVLTTLAGVVLTLRDRALYRGGEVTIGTVREVKSAKENQRTVYFVRFEFDTPKGVQKGNRSVRPSGLTGPIEPGPIWVIYDPQQPERNVLAVD